jgi:hypothetical protein
MQMDPDDDRLDMLRESIRLTEEILNGLVRSGTEHSETETESGVVARLTHSRDWRLRYLDHLEKDGQLLNLGDEWSMHHGHDLAIEWGYEAWDENRIGLRCRSCEDWIQLYDVDTGPTAEPTISDLYVEHETHTVLSWRRGVEAGIECVTCGAVTDDGFPLLATSVSDWFDEVWNG